MAGDWIKMRAALCTNPKVLAIAEIIGESREIGRRLTTGFNGSLSEIVTSDVTRDVTLGALLRVWCATNEHTSDGVWWNSTLRTIDAAAGFPGFGAAMEAVGWAIFDSEAGSVTLPNFLENNAPAKHDARSTGAERQARYRARKATISDASRDGYGDVTRDVTSDAREEKRREEKKDKSVEGFDAFWVAYPNRKAKADALKAWLKLKPDAELQALILEAIAVQGQGEDWLKEGGRFVPHAATWLNGKRWQDEGAMQGNLMAGAI